MNAALSGFLLSSHNASPAAAHAPEVVAAPVRASPMHMLPAASPSQIQFAASAVICELRVVSVDKRRGTVTYEMVLANEAVVPVSVCMYGVDVHNRRTTFGALAVAAQSVSRATFATPLHWGKHGGRAYLEAMGEGIHLLAEAQPPVGAANEIFASRPLLALCASIVLVLAAGIAKLGGAVGLAAPPAIALVVPHRQAPGIVNVAYAVEGNARASYRAALSDGTVLSSGTLAHSSGEIALTVPPGAAGHNVRVTLNAIGPLGTFSRSAAFAVIAENSAAPPARILSLSAHRESYDGGQTILASYSAIGTGGMLRILDPLGTVVASMAFTHVGTSRIAVPATAGDRTLRAELVVTRGRSRADAAVELPAQSDAKAEAKKILAMTGIIGADNSAPLDTANATVQDAGSTALPNDPFALPNHVVGGSTFEVTIRRALPHMHVELQDEMGTVLDDRPVSPGTRSIVLGAPKTSIVQTYYLVGTFERDSLEETLVRALRVFPN
jgi:hypothetical protein